MQLSVIIPTRNRVHLLKELIESLTRQRSVDFMWEVLIIDNGSTDTARSVWHRYKPFFPVPLRYLYEPNPGLHRCRNRGAKEAHGDIIAYLDDDMIVSKNWITGGDLILGNRAEAVVGKILPIWQDTVPDWAPLIYDGKTSGHWALLDLGDEPKKIEPDLAFGCNNFVKRKLVIDLKGFHPDGMPGDSIQYRGDGETGFYRQCAALGHRLMYDPGPIAHHVITPEKLTLDYVCERSFRQGISDSYAEIRETGGIKNHVFTKINNAYHRGKVFHQEKALNDASLLQWVLQPHYFDKDV
jgi:glycosyltransferase involved in cell wall biosynthesis